MAGSERLRVLFVSDHLGHPDGRVHGGTTFFHNTMPALVRAGVALTGLFLGGSHPARRELDEAGVPLLFGSRPAWDPRSLGDIQRAARRIRAQILHCHGFKSILLGRLAGRKLRIPAIIHTHDAIPNPPLVGFVQRRLAPLTAAAIAISDPIRDYTVREHGLPTSFIDVVAYGVDFERYLQDRPDARQRVRAEWGAPADAPVIILVGRVCDDKGQAELIRAVPHVLAEHPDARCVIVGEGATLADCRALARELGVQESVIFTGQRRDVPDLLAAADVVTMPSMWPEGFGFSALEGIASARPVVAFRVGAIPMTVIDGRTGLLVERGDVPGLAAALCRLLGDPGLRRTLGEQGRAHARRFTLERHVDHLLRIYRRVLGEPR